MLPSLCTIAHAVKATPRTTTLRIKLRCGYCSQSSESSRFPTSGICTALWHCGIAALRYFITSLANARSCAFYSGHKCPAFSRTQSKSFHFLADFFSCITASRCQKQDRRGFTAACSRNSSPVSYAPYLPSLATYVSSSQTWTDTYGLRPGAKAPTSPVQRPATTRSSQNDTFSSSPPLAPHLLDCSREAAKAEAAEALGGNGEVPEWWGEGGGPEPPWVRGGDEDNLPLTRTAQADIWRHQHPVNCNETGVRFLRIAWSDAFVHGLGSQLHIMTGALSMAMTHGRILVVAPASFTRANHDGCKGDARGSLNCYFESLTKLECGVRAEELLVRESGVTFIEKKTTLERMSAALTSAMPLVVYHIESRRKYESKAAL